MAWAVLYLQCGVKEQLCLLLSCLLQCISVTTNMIPMSLCCRVYLIYHFNYFAKTVFGSKDTARHCLGKKEQVLVFLAFKGFSCWFQER